ncbi:MAG: diadenylate cyclase CdaA [Kiritimatiellae bacterium]|nr:diadenylate cyclase CdaA [Kiritimatiellia bacterium]
MSGWWSALKAVGWPGMGGAVEIAVLAAVFYFGILFFQGTRGAQVLWGFLGVLVLFVMTWVFQWNTLNWLLGQLTGSLVLASVVIFQPEIRRALAELGKQHVPGRQSVQERENILNELVEAVFSMSKSKIGALIALERSGGTRAIQETGTRLDAEVSAALLCTIFFPRTDLHDGGVIIEGGRIRAAGCVFPLSADRMGGRNGTRHRAAAGMSEETDALVIVVSEETGAVSLASGGRLVRGLTEKELRRYLSTLFVRDRGKQGPWWKRLKEGLDLSPEAMERNDAD